MLIKPSLDDIQNAEKSLTETASFLSRFDPIPYFIDLWGEEDYREKSENLWEEAIQKFKEEKLLDNSWQELILIINFDFVLGPFIGLPEGIKLKFYPWVFEQIKDRVE